jgi:uncharacterized protein with HEPN domain
MTERDYGAYLEDVLEYCDRAIVSAKEITLGEFRDNLNMQDAFARRFEIIGEAVKHVPDSIRDLYPNIERKRAAAFRDVLAHDYVDIEIDLLYLTAKNDLPAFRDQIAKVLSDLENKK